MAELRKKSMTKKTDTAQMIENGKLQPQAVDLEEAVLGALMLEKNAITVVSDILKPESFYKDSHQIIFQSIKTLFSNAQPIDILTVTSDLRKQGQLEIVGGAYFITSLTNRVASAANIEYHARIIAQKFIQRELIRISTEIQRDAFEDSADAFELLDKAEHKLFEVSQGNVKRDYKQMNTIVREAIRDIEGLKDIFLNHKISIYNRWGKLVWTGNNNSNEWDGFANNGLLIDDNQVPSGTYYYVIELNDPNYTEPLTGYLYLTK